LLPASAYESHQLLLIVGLFSPAEERRQEEEGMASHPAAMQSELAAIRDKQ
jgi:hypothetical protein